MKEVIVNVKSIQRDADGKDTEIELFSNGRYYEKNGAKYIMYEESETIGTEGVKTTIKALPNSVVLIRSGATKMRHEYIVGAENKSMLQTPAGDLELIIKTHKYTNDIVDGKGTVHLGYDISIAGQWQFYNQVIIQIREDI